MTKRLPLGVLIGGSRHTQFGRKTELAVAKASMALRGDLRFEHLEEVDDLLWDLAVQARLNTNEDVAAEFRTRHAREVVETVCFIPVHQLNFPDEIQLGDVFFLPITDPRVPPVDTFREYEGPFKCVARVVVSGTHYGNMANRAREKAGNVLRLLRMGLIGRSIPAVQLRFKLGASYAIADELRGWNSRPDASYGLDLSADSLSDLGLDRYDVLRPAPGSALEIKADIAVRWMERARFAGEPLIEVLYLTFALEALLGDREEGLKSVLIARRQLILSHVMTGTIPNLDQTIVLYGEVRSKAVHGETTRRISSREADTFHHAVKITLDQYLGLASRENIRTQSDLMKILDEHGDNETLTEFLLHNGGPEWARYLKSMK